MLQSSSLEDHMNTIGIDLSSLIRSSFEHRCMNNIKNIYQRAGTFDDQNNLKDIIDAALLSTLEHRWDLPVLHYHKIMVIYPYPFFVVITQLFSCIILINGCICI